MASISKRGNVWQVLIFKQGVRTSKSFPTKTAAQLWASQIEAEIVAGKQGTAPPNKTFSDLLDKYATEVSPTKAGHRWEEVRIKLIQRDSLATIKLADLSQPHFSDWRDRRLKVVSAASVRREWVLLSAVCTIAHNEWRWLSHHPMKGVKLPQAAPPRDRIPTNDEIDRLKIALGYTEHPAKSVGHRVACAMLFAIETGMRAGEICNLRFEDINFDVSVAKVRTGKTAAARRDVALSPEALRLLNQIGEDMFRLTATQIDSNFRKAKKTAGIDDLHFHDTRALALTRLSKKLDILSLARMVGHRDLKMLQIYFRETAADIAKRLD
ncbi:MAG: site-specific integrase [Gallionella sp.]|nr:site-specific integrase [Gallionella sp.]